MLPTPAKDMRKLVPLDKIATYDRSIQVRGGIDPAKVERYRAIMRDNGIDGAVGYMDPIVVFYETDDGPRWIADGFHRIESAIAEKLEKIPTILRLGSRTKALRFALGENGHHGAPMTNAEKRHAAGLAVLDLEIGNLPDAEIARLVGCSTSLVADCRRGETPASKASKRAAKQQKRPPATSAPEPVSDPLPEPIASTPVRPPKDAVERPTKVKLLKQIQEWIDLDMLDEADIIGMFDCANAEYRYVPKPGCLTTLRVVGRNGRVQCEAEVVMKELGVDWVTLKYEREGKIVLQEA
jgi:hypothetical protein